MIQLSGSPTAFPRHTRAHSRFALVFSTLLLLWGMPGRAGAQTTYTGSGISIPQGSNYYATNSVSVSNAATVANVSVTLNSLYVDESTWSAFSLAGTSIVLAFCPTSGTCREFMLLGSTGDAFGGGATDDLGSSGINVTIQDGSPAAPGCSTPSESLCPAWQAIPSSQTYEPSSYWIDNDALSSVPSNSALGLPSPYSGYTLDFPQQDGSQSLNNEFSVSGAGTWTLIMADDTGVALTPVSISGWSLTLTFASSPSTTTTLSSNNNPSFASSPNNSVTFTATVTSTSTVTSGTVEFFANSSPISGCTAVAVSNGTATCTTSLTEGVNAITANYTGTGQFANGSSNTVDQVVIEHPTGDTTSNHWCTTSGFAIPGGSGVSSIYPSVIQVSGYPNGTSVTDVKVTLNGLYGDVDAQHLLVSPTNTYNLDFFDGSWYVGTLGSGSAVSPVFYDSAGAYPTWGGTPNSGNYEASDQLEAPQSDTFTSSLAAAATLSATLPIPQVPGTVIYGYNNQFPTERGASTNTFEYAFNGAPANGDWALYGYQQNDGTGETVGSWCIDLTLGTGNSTTTGVTSSQNPQAAQTSSTLTATVNSGGNPVASGGTVTFLDNGATPLASGGNSSNSQTLQSNGTAAYNTGSAYYSVFNGTGDTNVYEGDHNFTAEYSGSSSDNPSNSTVFWQRFDNLSTVTVTDNTHYSYCNAGPIFTRANTIGAFIPNPSNVFVTDLPGTVSTRGVTLKGLFTTGDTSESTQSMLEGPNGAALDFFSNNTGGSPLSFSPGNYTFADGAASLNTGSEFSPGTYAPRSGSSPDTFTASSSGFYNLPSSWGYAAPAGSSSFGSTFGSTLGDGTWSLFFNLSSLAGTTGALNGWCANFAVNAVNVTPTLSHNGTGQSGDFLQGESNAPITVSVENDGVNGSPGSPGNGTAGDPAGSNANPLTVVDTLPTGLTYASGSGANWSCNASAQTVTCTNDVASVSAGSSYPTLTIDVNVGAGASGSLNNSINVSGAGALSTPANDSIPVDAATVTAPGSETATYSASAQNVGMSATVTSNGSSVNVGTVTFTVYSGGTMVGGPVTSGTLNSSGVGTATYFLPGGTAPGTYTIDASYNGSTGYAISNQTASLTVNAFTPTFTWTPLSTIIVGDAGANVLNASVNCTSCGTISYTETPSGGSAASITTTTGLAAGSYTITANFSPDANYGANSASQPLTVSGESVWVVNSGGSTAELAGNGFGITSSAYSGGNVAAGIDSTGNVWTVGTGTNLLQDIGQTGISQHAITSGGGLDSPSAIAIDGNSQTWITNAGNNSVSLFLNGTSDSPSTGFTDSSLSTPSGVTVDLGGSVWIANKGNNSVTRFLGAAAPAAPPSTAAKNNTTGVKP